MNKILAVIRSVKEGTYFDCLNSIKERGFDFVVIRADSSLEEKSKGTILAGVESSDKYEWVMAVDADIVLTKSRGWIENYCDEMKELYDDKLFCFCGYLNCTKRGLISGMHFFRTRYCKEAYEKIKNVDFSYHKGREEYEICKTLQDKYNIKWNVGKRHEAFGTHYFEINNHA